MTGIKTISIYKSTRGNCDIADITDEISSALSGTGMSEGSVLVFVVGSTAALTTIEYEPGLLQDYPKLMEKLIPSNISYQHDNTWHDGNGHSHLRSALQGTSLTVPFKDGRLLLGTWQQVIFIDFDNRTRKREIVLQFTGQM